MSPPSHNYHEPSTPNRHGYENYHDHNPQFGMTPHSNTPKPNMYQDAGPFNDEMVAEVAGREHRSREAKNVDYEAFEDSSDDGMTPDEDSEIEEIAPKSKPSTKRKKAAAPAAKPRARGKKAAKDPVAERQKHADNNAEDIDNHSGIKDHDNWENEEHEYDSDDIAEFERQVENDDIPEGMALDANGKLVNKNGRVKGRLLVLWHRPRMIEKLVLHMQYELHRRGVVIPWNSIVHRLSPGSSGPSAEQHLNKLRDALVSEGHLVPPLSGKINQKQDTDIRGFLRDETKEGLTATRVVYWDEVVKDRKHSIINPGVVKGSGNYRKNPAGRGLDKLVKDSARKVGGRRTRVPDSEQPKSTGKRTRKQREAIEKDDSEEMALEDLETPSKRQKSTRSTRAPPNRSTNAAGQRSRMVTLPVDPRVLGRYPAGEFGRRGDMQYDTDSSPEIKRNSSEEDGSEYVDETPSKKRGSAHRPGNASEPRRASAMRNSSGLDTSRAVRRIDFEQELQAVGQHQESTKPRANATREAKKRETDEFRRNMQARYDSQNEQSYPTHAHAYDDDMNTNLSAYGQHQRGPQMSAQYSGNGHTMMNPSSMPTMSGMPFGSDSYQNGYGNMLSHHGLPNVRNAPAMTMNDQWPAGYGHPNTSYHNRSGRMGVSSSTSRMHQRQPNMSRYGIQPSNQGPSIAPSQYWEAHNKPQNQGDAQREHAVVDQPLNHHGMSFEAQNGGVYADPAVYNPHDNMNTVRDSYENVNGAYHSQYENAHGAQPSDHSPHGDDNAGRSSATYTPNEYRNDIVFPNNDMNQGFEMDGHDEGQASQLLDDAQHQHDGSGGENNEDLSFNDTTLWQ